MICDAHSTYFIAPFAIEEHEKDLMEDNDEDNDEDDGMNDLIKAEVVKAMLSAYTAVQG